MIHLKCRMLQIPLREVALLSLYDDNDNANRNRNANTNDPGTLGRLTKCKALSTLGRLAHYFSSSQTPKHGSSSMVTFGKKGNRLRGAK